MKKRIPLVISTIVKAVVFLAAIGYGFYSTNRDWRFLFYCLAEVILIYLFRLLFTGKSRAISAIGYVLSSLLFFFCFINIGSQIFAGTYVTYQMWNNLANIQALGSSLPIYIAAVVAGLIVSFLPMVSPKLRPLLRLVDLAVVVIAYVLIVVLSVPTPLMGWKSFIKDYTSIAATTKALEQGNQKVQKTAYTEFERDGIAKGIDTGLTNPNVIVLFTEGFSSEILDVNNGNMHPGLTPNLDKFSQQTINFTNFFNHTAATYRGVRGQLASSQQYSEGYEKGTAAVKKMVTTKLDSVQSILGQQGYHTEFINAEPNQPTWTAYVSDLGFDKVTTLPAKQLTKGPGENFVGDQQNYQLLLKRASQLNQQGKPFMLADYTFQTHVGENADLKYGDGSNAYLNKYHNLDDAFGKFWTAFQKSPLAQNTIIVFTADHATFPDPTYNKTFKTSRAYFISPVPLMIWYPGLVKPQTIDAGGKNSLSVAPTILDLMGKRDAKNYFLGNSLFAKETSPMQYTYSSPGSTPEFASTKGITEQDTRVNKNLAIPANSPLAQEITRYYSISMNYNDK